MKDSKSIILDDSHRRVLEVTFSLLDEMLIKFERWANRQESHSILYQENNTLSDAQCRAVLEDISKIKNIIQKLTADLDLVSHKQSVVRAIKAQCELFVLDNLLTLEGHDFDAYGKTSESLINYLTPNVDEIVKLLEKISDIEEKFNDVIHHEHFEHDRS